MAAAYRADDLLDLLGIDISPARLKCAMLSLQTLDAALAELDGSSAPAPARRRIRHEPIDPVRCSCRRPA